MPHRRPQRRLSLLAERLRRRLAHRPSREATELIASAVLVGALAGLGAVGFDWAVNAMEGAFRSLRAAVPAPFAVLAALLLPALGGLLITPIVLRWAPDARGSGIPGVMVAASNLAGRLPRRLVLWRPLASAISIGTGAPLGTEGPVVQLSGAIASVTSGLLRLGDERRRNLLAVAAAGGISATFNAPIAGMLFALEVILGEFGSRFVASVVIGSVTASVVSRAFLGPDPAFAVPDYGLAAPAQLPLYFLLGVLAGLAAVGVSRALLGADDLLARLAPPRWARPALGGLFVGALGLAFPRVLGRGFDTTGAILQGELVGVGLLVGLAAAKLLATSAALAAWHSGGIFAPLLLIGAALGGAFGDAAGGLLPGLGLQAGAFALVGMAAVLSGAVGAPMSSILMVFEMSNDYRLILPLLLATVVATLVAEAFGPGSIYHVLLARRGQTLLRLRADDLLQTVRVGEIMEREAPRLPGDATLADLARAIGTSHHHGFLLDDPARPGGVLGIATLSDLERARREGVADDAPVAGIASRALHVALPDDPISDVLERMARLGIGRMPVVDPRERWRPVGFVRQSDLAKAYYRAVERERALEERAEATRLRDLTGQEIVEVRVPPGGALAGRTLREAQLPPWSIVVAIRRDGRTVFPHGDTRLEPDDVVVANVEPGGREAFRRLFERAPRGGP